jgi:hypothetical protein
MNEVGETEAPDALIFIRLFVIFASDISIYFLFSLFISSISFEISQSMM